MSRPVFTTTHKAIKTTQLKISRVISICYFLLAPGISLLMPDQVPEACGVA